MLTRLVVLAAALVATGSAVAQNPPKPDCVLPRPDPGQPVISIDLPRVMTVEEWHSYLDVLRASDAQRFAFEHPFIEYVKAFNALYCDRYVEVRKAAMDLGRLDQSSSSEELTTYEHLMTTERTEIVRAFDRLATALWTALSAGLAESQLPRLEFVRRLRERDRIRSKPFPASQFDIEQWLFRVHDEDRFVIPWHDDELDALLAAYRTAIMPLVRTARNSELERRRQGARIRHLMNDDPEAWQAARVRLGRPIADAYRRMIEVNSTYIDLIAARLGPDAATALECEFREEAYPIVFPNPYEITDVFAAAEEAAGTSGRTPAIQEAISFWSAATRVVEQEMCRAFITWRHEHTMRLSYSTDGYDAYSRTMNELEDRRLLASETTVELLTQTLDDRITQEFERAVAGFHERALAPRGDAVTRRLSDGRWPPPQNEQWIPQRRRAEEINRKRDEARRRLRAERDN